MKNRIAAAQGQIPCDLIIKNITYLDVFHCVWRKGDLAIHEGFIVGVEPGLRGIREIDGRGKFAVPGFIDAHVHIESSLMTPLNFEKVVLEKGTTTAICDPHELANVMGVDGIKYFLECALHMHMDLRVMLSSCVPATDFETNGGGTISAADLKPLLEHPKALGLAEMMNVPGVLNSDPAVMDKINAFMGRPIDGHAPLVKGHALSAYACAGISSCHESSELSEASEKLTKGISVWIREGSVAKDLAALLPLLSLSTSTSLGFCTDDRNPLDIATEGHLDFLIRTAISAGIPEEIVYRSASWSVARHYGLDRGKLRKGAVSPGYVADVVLLSDSKLCKIDAVLSAGRFVHELPKHKSTVRKLAQNTVRSRLPSESELQGPSGKVNVIGVIPKKIITEHLIMDSATPGVLRFSVLERYGQGSLPSNGYVTGFGESFRGAIASSIGHDSHNLTVIGSNLSDMRLGLQTLQEIQGGLVVISAGKTLAQLPLPFGGLMSEADPKVIEQSLRDLRAASRSIGCEIEEPFLQMAFLALPVIPKLKLTDKGLFDVEKFRLIPVQAS